MNLTNFQTRLIYFALSQLFAGFLLSHVVTYNHYSTDKFPRIFIYVLIIFKITQKFWKITLVFNFIQQGICVRVFLLIGYGED